MLRDTARPEGEPDLSAPAPAQPGPGGGHRIASASLGIFFGDVAAGGVLVLGAVAFAIDMDRGRSEYGLPLLLVGAAAWVFLPPALGVSWATRAGAPPSRWTRAYWSALGVRLGGLLLAAGAGRESPWLGALVLAATELVVAPGAVVWTLEGGAGQAAEPPRPSPAQLAHHVVSG